MKKIAAGLLLFPFFILNNLMAQIMSNPSQWYINNQMYSTRVFNDVIANKMLEDKSAMPGYEGQAAPATDYTIFEETSSNKIPSEFSNNSIQKSSDEIGKDFQLYWKLYQETAQKDGFPTNDLAYAYEYFIINSYNIYYDLIDFPLEKDPWAKKAIDGFDRIVVMNNKKLAQISLTQEQQVFQQLKETLSQKSEIRIMTDAEKQYTAQLLVTALGSNFYQYINAVNDENEKEAENARMVAKESIERTLGVSIEKLNIGYNGLEY